MLTYLNLKIMETVLSYFVADADFEYTLNPVSTCFPNPDKRFIVIFVYV